MDDPPGSSSVDDPAWLELMAAAAVVYEQAVSQVPFPVMVLDLPSRRIRAANDALADVFEAPVSSMLGVTPSDIVTFSDERAMIRAVEALSDGTVEGYRATRSVTTRSGAVVDADVWGRAVDLEGVRYAVYIVAPRSGDTAGWSLSGLHVVGTAVGTASDAWLVERVSVDIRDVLGVEWSELVGRSLLTRVHPDDLPRLLRATEDDSLGGKVTCRHMRWRHASGDWVLLRTLVIRTDGNARAHIAFGFLPAEPATGAPESVSDRVAELQGRLYNIAGELRAAGVLDDAQGLLSINRHPQLNELTSRQWEILVRLRRGDRVPTIAADLFLSQATVRNHLAAIFAIFGVHSQSELLALLRT